MTEVVNNVRRELKMLGAAINTLKSDVANSEVAQGEDRGEVLANLTLAYRHMEDASMRLGKVLQARDGGVSVYDKETTMGVTPQA